MLNLIIPSFIAGLLTFFAPCTLPIIPSYLGFVGGVSTNHLLQNKTKKLRRKILLNSILYILGFSIVFITLGGLFSLGGQILGQHRLLLSRIGGIFIILFGFFIIQSAISVKKIKWLSFLHKEKRFHLFDKLKPGHPLSAFVFGSVFAFGWTPCIGPILGSILLLVSNNTTTEQGVFLLLIFSFGLALPFLIISFAVSSTLKYLPKINKYLNIISIMGGIFLIFIGLLLLTENMSIWTTMFFKFINLLK